MKWKVIIDDKEPVILDEDAAYEFRSYLGMKDDDIFPTSEQLKNAGINRILIENQID